ncbi:hypothetical protein PCASD_21474 [Puccinia coronata f. sp. avenae]|uniref:Uncharacterized protein n=1 Tax=Puccinia coronata f. sp. avenae TaxID=200324 RepID=A0A2N5S9L5_9BASI|nr:hypothetical protein PCASD_21474 [Puccinia coronata f. sp. avenae]
MYHNVSGTVSQHSKPRIFLPATSTPTSYLPPKTFLIHLTINQQALTISPFVTFLLFPFLACSHNPPPSLPAHYLSGPIPHHSLYFIQSTYQNYPAHPPHGILLAKTNTLYKFLLLRIAPNQVSPFAYSSLQQPPFHTSLILLIFSISFATSHFLNMPYPNSQHLHQPFLRFLIALLIPIFSHLLHSPVFHPNLPPSLNRSMILAPPPYLIILHWLGGFALWPQQKSIPEISHS